MMCDKSFIIKRYKTKIFIWSLKIVSKLAAFVIKSMSCNFNIIKQKNMKTILQLPKCYYTSNFLWPWWIYLSSGFILESKFSKCHPEVITSLIFFYLNGFPSRRFIMMGCVKLYLRDHGSNTHWDYLNDTEIWADWWIAFLQYLQTMTGLRWSHNNSIIKWFLSNIISSSFSFSCSLTFWIFFKPFDNLVNVNF